MKIKINNKAINDLKLSSLLLVTILSVPYKGDSLYVYIAVAVLLIFLIIENKLFRIDNNHSENSKTIERIAFTFLLTWAIGVINGIINGNALSNVFHNFIGCICYVSFFVLIATKTDAKEKIIKLVFASAKIATVLLAIASIEIHFGRFDLFPANSVDYNFYTFAMTSTVEAMSFALYSYCIYDMFVEKKHKTINNLLWSFICIYITLLNNERGGYLLAFLGVTVITMYCVLYKKMSRYKNRYLAYVTFGMVFICFAIYEYLSPNSLIRTIFDPTDFGNSIRYKEFTHVFGRIKLLGNGLGTEYSYSIFGKMKEGYLIEISYLDLIDKFGIFSIPLFYSYYKTIRLIVDKINKSQQISGSCSLAIGMMSFLFIGVGNPVIFIAYNVLLHCLVLYFLW